VTRILTITNLYPPHAFGGYEWSCHDVMRRFVERGHEVTVLTTTTRIDGVDDPPDEAGAGVHRELEWYWDDHRLLSPHPLRRAAMERRNHLRLHRLLDEVDPEVVSVWNVGAMSLGLLRAVAERGIPMVYAVCDEWPVYGPHLDAWGRLFARRPRTGRLAELLLRVPARAVDLGPTGAFCFVSEHTREACRAASPFTFPISTVVLSGIERSDFPPVEPGARPWRGELLYVGRLDERKGVLTAVDALAELGPAYRLRFVGRGDAHGAILQRADERGVHDRVTVDALARHELAAVYRAADALLFTSEWEEPFGLTPIEAMACATPVVGTGTGGSAAFLVDEVTCLRYRPGDATALAQCVRRLADDAALRQRLVDAGLSVADDLTTDRLAEVFAAWHEAAASGYARGVPADRTLRTMAP
jgi:glycosyltransferase involved in cell wall biosynthesis